MKFEVTLKQLRANKACVDGYNKVVSALNGVEYDKSRNTYIRYKYDAPIPLLSILDTNGLFDALWCLRCHDKKWARDGRLFAVWCARQVQHVMTDKRSINALDVAERYANNDATSDELAAAWAAAWAALAAAGAAARTAVAAASAAGAAAGAAWDAAVAAVAAASAASAARAAAVDAQTEMFIKMCNGTAPWQH